MVGGSSAMPPRKNSPTQDAAERLDIGPRAGGEPYSPTGARRQDMQPMANRQASRGPIRQRRPPKDNQPGRPRSITSRAAVWARMRNCGLSRKRPTTTSRQRSEGHANRDPAGPGPRLASSPPGARKATKGKQTAPEWRCLQQQGSKRSAGPSVSTAHTRSFEHWKTIAVEVSVKPMPNTKEMVGEKSPSTGRMPVSGRRPTLLAPGSDTKGPENFRPQCPHSRRAASASPMTKRNHSPRRIRRTWMISGDR